MTNSQIFKSQFPDFKGVVDFFTSDCKQINFIDVRADLVEFTETNSASCGCCLEIEENAVTLNSIMDSIPGDEFQDLLNLLK